MGNWRSCRLSFIGICCNDLERLQEKFANNPLKNEFMLKSSTPVFFLRNSDLLWCVTRPSSHLKNKSWFQNGLFQSINCTFENGPAVRNISRFYNKFFIVCGMLPSDLLISLSYSKWSILKVVAMVTIHLEKFLSLSHILICYIQEVNIPNYSHFIKVYPFKWPIQ
jgi:hypothetical protein